MKETMTATMKNTYEVAKKADANNASPIRAPMKQRANNIFVERDETGELVYHWIDTRVDMLSSSRLWSILGSPPKGQTLIWTKHLSMLLLKS